MIKLVLIDPQDLFRAGIKHLIAQYRDIELIADLPGAKDLAKLECGEIPDIYIISSNIQDSSILSLIKKLKRHCDATKILILANEFNIILAKQFLMLGADGFLMKTISEKQFVDAIKKLQQNKTVMPEALTEGFSTQEYNKATFSPFESLSARELDILLLLVKGKSVKQVSEILHLSPKTISTYKGRIFEKLNVTSMMDVFLLAIKFGLIKSESFA